MSEAVLVERPQGGVRGGNPLEGVLNFAYAVARAIPDYISWNPMKSMNAHPTDMLGIWEEVDERAPSERVTPLTFLEEQYGLPAGYAAKLAQLDPDQRSGVFTELFGTSLNDTPRRMGAFKKLLAMPGIEDRVSKGVMLLSRSHRHATGTFVDPRSVREDPTGRPIPGEAKLTTSYSRSQSLLDEVEGPYGGDLVTMLRSRLNKGILPYDS